MEILDTLVRWFAVGCAIVAGFILVGVAIIGAGNVVGYSLLGGGIPGAHELSASGLAAMFFLALPLTQLRDANVHVDIVANLLGARSTRGLALLAIIGAIIVFGLMTYMAYPFVIRSYRLSESAQGILPYAIWPIKLAALIGIAGACVVALLQLAKDLLGGRR